MKEEQYWARQCKTKDCRTLAHPLSDYCKLCRKKRKELMMDDVYDDGSDHIVCEKCGFCIKCGDCKEFGCGRKQ